MTERWLATFAAMTDLAAEDAIDRDLLIGELEASRFSETVLREDDLEPARLGLPRGGGAVHAARPRVRAAGRPPDLDRRPARGAAGGVRGRPGDARRQRGPAGRAVPDRDRAASAGRRRGADRRCAGGRRGGVGRSGGRRPADRVSMRQPRPRAPRWPPSRPTCATSSCPPATGEGRLGAALFAREDAPHDAIRDAHAGADHGRGRARVRGDPGRDGPPGARALAGLAGR